MKNLCGEYVQLPTLQVMEIVMAQIKPPRCNIFSKGKDKHDTWTEYPTRHPNQKVVLKFEAAENYRGLGENLCNFLNELKDDLNTIIYGEERYKNSPPVWDRKSGKIIHEGYRKVSKTERDCLKNFIINRAETLYEDAHDLANDMDYHINQFNELTPFQKGHSVLHDDYEASDNIEK